MFVKVLSILDLFALVTILFLHFAGGGFGTYVILTAAYLIGKGLLFFGDWFSIIDITIGIYVILLSAGVSFMVTFIFAAFLVYKIIIGLFVY